MLGLCYLQQYAQYFYLYLRHDSNVTDSSSITTTIDTVKPDQPVYSLEDTGSLNNDGITSNGVITINNLETLPAISVCLI
jgi:hypothetical protein